MIILQDEAIQTMERHIENIRGEKIRFIDKINKIDDIANMYGFIKIGQGTNRNAYVHETNPNIAIKIPFQQSGVADNYDEYALSRDNKINKYLTETYNISPNGNIIEAEFVDVVSKEDWDSHVRGELISIIIPDIMKYYVMGDITTDVARTNVGIDRFGNYRILDYAYMISNKSPYLTCDKCGSSLELIRGTEILECSYCHDRYDVNDIIDKKRRCERNDRNKNVHIPTIEEMMFGSY